MFNLSPDHAITRSLKLFGVSESSDVVLVCVLNASETQKAAKFALVEGEEMAVSRLDEVCDQVLVKETYQITKEESEITPISDAVVNRISAKISKKVNLAPIN